MKPLWNSKKKLMFETDYSEYQPILGYLSYWSEEWTLFYIMLECKLF